MPTFKGTNKGDTIRGSALADKITALGGNDIIYGFGGNDTIDAGSGDDTIDPGAGSDTIDGGLGIDTLDYSSWTGSIRVSAVVPSNQPSWRVEEYGSNNSLLSTDTFTGVENLVATSGNDLVSMGADNNSIWGGAGDDRLNAGGGNDTIYGGAGDDLVDGSAGYDLIDGGAGNDTLFWDAGAALNMTIDLQAGTITFSDDPNVDTLVGIENVRGAGYNEQIYGDTGSNIVQGGYGSDLIDGRDGDDLLVGDLGRPATVSSPYFYGYDDTIRGGAGNDLISGDVGTDVLTGGSGADIFGVDTYYGTDRITDFEDGVDRIALYGGLAITGWEGRDTDGDGSVDTQAALLSNGEAILFDGAVAPSSIVSGSGVVLHSEQFAIPELTDWSAAAGAPWDSGTAGALYSAAATPTPVPDLFF